MENYLHILHTLSYSLYFNLFMYLTRHPECDRCEAILLIVIHKSEKTFAHG